jgi:DNA-binding FadR family transcriptional regulator
MFRTVRQSNIYQDVIDQIESSIKRGDFKIGERLPIEKELQKAFGVSRTPVREALRALEKKGFIEIRKGAKGGSYVKAIEFNHIADDLDRLIRQHLVSMNHLAEFRMVIEGAAAGLAAERAAPEDIAELKDLVNKMEQYAQTSGEDYDQFYKIERQCHLLLVRICGNPMYQWVLTTILTNIAVYYGLLARRDRYIDEVLDDWRQVIESLKKGEVAKISDLISAHVFRSNRFLEQKAKEIGLLSSDGRLNNPDLVGSESQGGGA